MALGAMGVAAIGPLDRAVAASVATSGALPAIATQKFLVVIELDGGNDGLNMVVPQTLPNYALRRPTLQLSAAQTQALDTGPFATTDFRLHGRMPRLATSVVDRAAVELLRRWIEELKAPQGEGGR